MARLTPVSLAQAATVLADYGVKATEWVPIEAGSVNSNFKAVTASGDRYFARVYEEQDLKGAEAELRLVDELHELGLPVARALPRSTGGFAHEVGNKPFAVYPWVEGEILCQGRVTAPVAEQVGRALARLHQATHRVSPLKAGRFNPSDLERRLDELEACGRDELAQAAAGIRQQLADYSSRRPVGLPSGVIHGDLFRDNVLWDGDRIAALIDFESASTGTFVYDLMVTLLAWCYGEALDTQLSSALLRGYSAERTMQPAELDALEVEGALACLRFATTRLTDFSLRTPPDAEPRRDYRRFLARLRALESGVLDDALGTLRPRGTRATFT
jgi:homoserine kinase type II